MRWNLGAALITAATLFAPQHSRADEAEIVVTATRGPAQAARTPSRVDVVTRGDIEARSLSTLPEALGSQAVQAGGVGQQASLFLRGANSAHVLALVDGVRLNDASNPSGQYDFGQDTLGALERIEVLRGPASALYGSDAIGGVVNLIPRRGGEHAVEPFLEAAAGSFETYRILLGATGGAGALSYGVSAESFDTAGYDLVPSRMSTHTGDADGARLDSATLSARVDAGAAAFDFLARLRDSRADYDTFMGGPFFDLRADDPDLSNESHQSLWRIAAEKADTNSLLLRAEAGQVFTDRAETDGALRTSSAHANRDFANATARVDTGRSETTIGIAFERNAIRTIPQYAAPLAVAERQVGGFFITQFEASRRAFITASARLDDFQRFGEQDTYSAGVVYDLAPVRLYASAGTGFRAPSLSERYEVSFFNLGNPALKPERSSSWEAGADWRARDGWKVSATYYQMRIEDLIEYDFGQLRNINIGEAEIEGAELGLDAKLTDWAWVRIGYDWTDARNAETGVLLPRRPDNAWRFNVRITPSERWNVDLTWNSVGRRTDVTYDDSGGFLSVAGRVGGYSVVAVAASFDLSPTAEAFVRIDNLLDETYEQPAAFAGAPRNAIFGLRVRP